MGTKSLADVVTDLEEAKKYIRQLEEKLDEAIAIILRRDDELEKAERKILELEEKLEQFDSAKNE